MGKVLIDLPTFLCGDTAPTPVLGSLEKVEIARLSKGRPQQNIWELGLALTRIAIRYALLSEQLEGLQSPSSPFALAIDLKDQ